MPSEDEKPPVRPRKTKDDPDYKAAKRAKRAKARGGRTTYKAGTGTRIARDVRDVKRKPPPVPKGKTLEEIKAMDQDDPILKHPQGATRKHEGKDPEEMSWQEVVRAANQKKKNKKRAKARKSEAIVIVAAQEFQENGHGTQNATTRELALGTEDMLIADGTLTLEDWDDDEIAKGYRRNRNGNFGPPPKYIPREIQQEVVRRLVRQHKKELQNSFVEATKELVKLAKTADSEKVRLSAIQEIMQRVAGKVPETLKIEQDSPWQDLLVDEVVPLEDLPVLDVTATRRDN